MSNNVDFGELVGKVLTRIEVSYDEIIFHCENEEKYRMFHEQDCCEIVAIEDIVGDLTDLLSSPILLLYSPILRATKDSDQNAPIGIEKAEDPYGSSTWTFYNISTAKGYVTIRWYGESNGYYSESVDFEKL